MTTRSLRMLLGSALAIALAAAALVGPASASEHTKKARAKAKEKAAATAEARTPREIQRVKGKQLKVAKAKVANNWYRINDPVGDQVGSDGSLLQDAPPWSDLTKVGVVRSEAAVKMLRVLGEDYPPGTNRSWTRALAEWDALDDAYFVIAQTEGKLPRDSEAMVQLIVTFDGSGALPVQPSDSLGLYSGAESISISGRFAGGLWDSGTTHLDGWQRGEELPFFNGPSGDMGYYDSKAGALMHVARMPDDATSATVTLRTDGPDGETFDSVRVPGGGRFLSLADAAWGLDVKDAGTPLRCRALSTVSAGGPGAEDLEPGTSLVRYSVGWQAESGLGSTLDDMTDSLMLELLPAGSDEDPLQVDADLELSAANDAATFTLVVPDGTWLIGSADGEELVAPGGQLVVDSRPLTGGAGFETGPGLDGFVGGDPDCGG